MRSGLRREGNGSRSSERAGSTGEDRRLRGPCRASASATYFSSGRSLVFGGLPSTARDLDGPALHGPVFQERPQGGSIRRFVRRPGRTPASSFGRGQPCLTARAKGLAARRCPVHLAAWAACLVVRSLKVHVAAIRTSDLAGVHPATTTNSLGGQFAPGLGDLPNPAVAIGAMHLAPPL
jgi:hypothetical protein